MRLPIPREEDGSALMGECAACSAELYQGQECRIFQGELLCCACAGEEGMILRLGEGKA